MTMIEKHVPDITKFKGEKRILLETLWEYVLKERSKHTTRKRAKIAATVAVYSKILNEECVLFPKIKRKKFLLREEKKYKKYELKRKGQSLKVIITTEDKVLEDYKHINTKGRIMNATKEYDQEILSKIIEKYSLDIHPNTNTYYVIYSENEE